MAPPKILTGSKLLEKISSSSSKGVNVRTYNIISHLQHLLNNETNWAYNKSTIVKRTKLVKEATCELF